jgi:hypothetical protein
MQLWLSKYVYWLAGTMTFIVGPIAAVIFLFRGGPPYGWVLFFFLWAASFILWCAAGWCHAACVKRSTWKIGKGIGVDPAQVFDETPRGDDEKLSALSDRALETRPGEDTDERGSER